MRCLANGTETWTEVTGQAGQDLRQTAPLQSTDAPFRRVGLSSWMRRGSRDGGFSPSWSKEVAWGCVTGSKPTAGCWGKRAGSVLPDSPAGGHSPFWPSQSRHFVNVRFDLKSPKCQND